MTISDFLMGVRETFERNLRDNSEECCGQEEAIDAIMLNFDMAISEVSDLAFGDLPIGGTE